MTRRIAVVTSNRADYGHLHWLLREIHDDPALELQLIVTGAHLLPEFGSTISAIEADGFPIAARVAMPLGADTPGAAVRSLGQGTVGMADAFERLAPHLLVLLGDRYELLAAASAATLFRLPIAHLHGGEATEGAMDDSIRHAITKLSHLHFAAAETYAQRIRQMGEDPAHVFCVGAPGLDWLARMPLLSPAELAKRLELGADGPLLLVTYHPVTLEPAATSAEVAALVTALDRFPGARIVVTGVNSDPQYAEVRAALNAVAERRPDRVRLVASLGQVGYLSAQAHAAAVIGNSSSGIIEAPAVGTPTVNIGDRQAGRLRAASVIDCIGDADAIAGAVRRALSSEFRTSYAGAEPPYGRAGASTRIKAILASFPLDGLARKRFNDISGDMS